MIFYKAGGPLSSKKPVAGDSAGSPGQHRKAGPTAGLPAFTYNTKSVVQRLDAAERRRRYAQITGRYTHVMQVIIYPRRVAVVLIHASRGGRTPVIVRVAARVAAPLDLDDQVILAVVVEAGSERETEPSVRRSGDILGALGIDLHRRVAAVVAGEIGRERRLLGVAELDAEIIERARAHRRAGVPLPLNDRPGGDRVGTQNQILAPYGIDASTSPKWVRGGYARAAYRNGIGERYAGSQRTQKHNSQNPHRTASLWVISASLFLMGI